MEASIQSFSPIMQALLATLFTWGVTALGAAGVFLAKDISQKVLDIMLGFAAGVMIAASYWSLLAPAIEMSGEHGWFGLGPRSCWFFVGRSFFICSRQNFTTYAWWLCRRGERRGRDELAPQYFISFGDNIT